MRVLGVGAILGVAAATFLVAGASRVQGQAASPSVRAAARLKYNPPPNWIRHYLGDDRYKLQGGTWKVVSTETDTYYYPAWAPEMLRQSNSIVIGFPSAAAAEEAGYKRSKYPMESPLLGLTGRPVPTPAAPTAAGGLAGITALSLPEEGAVITANKGARRRVVLSDGVSSTSIPGGWTHIKATRPTPTGNGQSILLDIFVPGNISTIAATKDARNSRPLIFGFTEIAGAEKVFNGSMLRNIESRMESQGRVNTSVSRQVSALRSQMQPSGFGNVRGIRMTVPTPEFGSQPMHFAARGSKVYIMLDMTRGAKGSRDIIRSFQGR